jgi:hypothetical protein
MTFSCTLIHVQEWSPMSDIHLQRDGFLNYSMDSLEEGKLGDGVKDIWIYGICSHKSLD